jgi:hypothetical protein
MKELKQEILDALHDATNLKNGKVDLTYFDALLDEIVSEKCNQAEVIKSVCPACGSKYYDEDNNVKRCQDCYTIF